MAWIGSVMYVRFLRSKHAPPFVLAVYWTVWSLGAIGSFILAQIDWTNPVLIPFVRLWFVGFLIMEVIGVVAGTRGRGGWTYSEWVWWNLRPVWLKWAWTSALVLQAALYLHPGLAVLLAIWLFPHFALRGR